MSFSIVLNALRVPVSIGWSDGERAKPQAIRFDLEITLDQPPSATATDQLLETIDYQAVSELIRQVATRDSYHLLERLVLVVRDEVRRVVPREATLTLRVTKEKPPIPDLDGGASVILVDRPTTDVESRGSSVEGLPAGRPS